MEMTSSVLIPIFSRVWRGGLQARWTQRKLQTKQTETATGGEVQTQEHQQVHLLLQEGTSEGLGESLFISLLSSSLSFNVYAEF